MNEAVETATQVAERVARHYARRVWWADPEDLRQEAMVAALKAEKTFDGRIGVPFTAYAFRACCFHLRRWAWKNGSPVSAADHPIAAGVLRGVHASELDEQMRDNAPLADDLLADAEHARNRDTGIRHQVQFLLGHALPGADIVARLADAYAAELVLVDEVQPGEVATRLGMKPVRVYRTVRRARELLSENQALFNMWSDL